MNNKKTTLLGWCVLYGLALFSIVSSHAQSFPTKITNRWTGEHLGLSNGVPYLSVTATDTWVFEPSADDNFFRIKHVASGIYLHNQNEGKLAAGAIQFSWWSAMWTVKSVDGHIHIINRWNGKYLLNEKKVLELGDLGAPGWWSAQWKIFTLPVNLTSFATLVGPSITPGKYYRIQLKTSAEYHLRVWNTGLIGSSKEQKPDAFSEWLFIPTGDEIDTYWVFNKGAQEGRGQLMAIPPTRSNYNQWDFIPNDARQKFKLQGAGNGYFRMISKETTKAVSTRWNEMAFEWGVNTSDDQQLFRLVESSNINEKEDMLPSYIYWNSDVKQVKYYFNEICKINPPPQLLNVKKFVFYNSTSKNVIPVVHRVGCGGAPWRDGKPQCGWKELKPGEDWTFEVSDYLKNADQIWTIIGWSTAVIAAIAITVVTVGTAAPAIASSFGAAGATTAGITLSYGLATQLTLGAIGVIDLFIFTPGFPAIGEAAKSLSKPDEISAVQTEFNKIGLNPSTYTYLKKNLGDNFFYCGEKYSNSYINGFYLEETSSQTKIDEFYYANGICIFIVSDSMIKK